MRLGHKSKFYALTGCDLTTKRTEIMAGILTNRLQFEPENEET